MTIATALLVLVVAHGATSGISPRCLSRGGNIECTDSGGRRVLLTEAGLDRDPSVNASGNQVVFLRRKNGQNCDEVWTSEIRPGAQPALIFSGRVERDGRGGCEFKQPGLSRDKGSLYFLVDYAATSDFVVCVDVRTQSYRFFQPGIRFTVVPCGKYEGHLVVQQRRVTLAGAYYYYFWLYAAKGEEVGLAAIDEQELETFLNDACKQKLEP